MSEYTIGSTNFIPKLPRKLRLRSQQAQALIDGSAVRSAKFVLILQQNHDKVLSLFVTSGGDGSVPHLLIARGRELSGDGDFFGAGRLKNIGKRDIAAEWGSDTCLKHYGYDTPKGIDAQELGKILELVKLRTFESLEQASHSN